MKPKQPTTTSKRGAKKRIEEEIKKQVEDINLDHDLHDMTNQRKFSSLEKKFSKFEKLFKTFHEKEYKRLTKLLPPHELERLKCITETSATLSQDFLLAGTSPLDSPFIKTNFSSFQKHLVNLYFRYQDNTCFFLNRAFVIDQSRLGSEKSILLQAICSIAFDLAHFLAMDYPLQLKQNTFYMELKTSLDFNNKNIDLITIYALAICSYLEYGGHLLNSATKSMVKAIRLAQYLRVDSVFASPNSSLVKLNSLHLALIWNYCANCLLQDSSSRSLPPFRLVGNNFTFLDIHYKYMQLQAGTDMNIQNPLLSFKVIQLFSVQNFSKITKFQTRLKMKSENLTQNRDIGMRLLHNIGIGMNANNEWIEKVQKQDKALLNDPLFMTKAYHVLLIRSQFLLLATTLSTLDYKPGDVRYDFNYQPFQEYPNLERLCYEVMYILATSEQHSVNHFAVSHRLFPYFTNIGFATPLCYTSPVYYANPSLMNPQRFDYCIAKLRDISIYWPVANFWVQQISESIVSES